MGHYNDVCLTASRHQGITHSQSNTKVEIGQSLAANRMRRVNIVGHQAARRGEGGGLLRVSEACPRDGLCRMQGVWCLIMQYEARAELQTVS